MIMRRTIVPDYSNLAASPPLNLRPNKLTATILKMSDAGKGVKHITTKKAFYADLGI
jgi:hypothetical protein